MRKGLTWSLLTTLVLSGLALWMPSKPAMVAAIEPRLHEGEQARAELMSRQPPVAAVGLEPLPVALPSLELEPALRDIFMAVPVAPAAPVVKAPPAPPAPVAVVVAPQAPAVQWRFLGRMQSPDGKTLVYLGRGENAITVAAGDKLDDGYMVEAIQKDAVVLLFPSLDQRARIQIAPPPPNASTPSLTP